MSKSPYVRLLAEKHPAGATVSELMEHFVPVPWERSSLRGSIYGALRKAELDNEVWSEMSGRLRIWHPGPRP